MYVTDVLKELDGIAQALEIELNELRLSGVPVLVSAQDVLLCEMLGFTCDLETGEINGSSDDRVWQFYQQ